MATRVFGTLLLFLLLGTKMLVAQQPLTGQLSGQHETLPGRVIDVQAGEFFFRAVDTIPAGLTTFRLQQVGMVVDAARAGVTGRALVLYKGDGTGGLHTLAIVRLDSGRTVADLHRAAQAADQFPSWSTRLGGLAFAVPPRTSNATLLLEPGQYALVCDIGSAQEDRTRFHFLKGMYRTLTVVSAARSRITLPKPDVTARITADGAIEFLAPIAVGRSLIRVENASGRTYGFKLLKIPTPFTGKRFLADPTTGAGIPWGGLSEVPAGGAVTTTIDFEPGHYVAGTRISIRHPSTVPFFVAAAKP